MSSIFGEVGAVTTCHGDFLEKYVGDTVVALSGVPTDREDDHIRAVRAARRSPRSLMRQPERATYDTTARPRK